MNEGKPVASAEMLAILRSVDLFENLTDDDLERVYGFGRVRTLGPGEMLFRAGDPPDSIHVVLDGVLEIARTTPDHPEPVPVAYVSPGEAIGDMAMLTGASRRSSGRVPEKLKVWSVDRPAFERLSRSLPGFGLQMATVFARRLEEFINHMRGQTRRKELSGKLEFFDLPTVVQTLVTSNQTGMLTILSGRGEKLAEVLLCDGAVERARCGALEGEEAFFQIFLGDAGGEFLFRTVADPDRDAVSRAAITLSAMNLLMEAMRLLDELPSVQRRLPDPEREYRAKTDDLSWEEDATVRVALEILAKLRTPRKIQDLVGQVPCSTFTLYRVAAELYETNQIG